MRYYIAYGSNLNLSQMALRCPKSEVFGSACLNDYELLFRGTMGNSHATIAPKKGSSVPILVWRVPKADEKRLDIYEGYPRYYFKQELDVLVDGKAVTAMVYIMNLSRKPGLPSPAYVEAIRQGYEDNGFNQEDLYEAIDRNIAECSKKKAIQ